MPCFSATVECICYREYGNVNTIVVEVQQLLPSSSAGFLHSFGKAGAVLRDLCSERSAHIRSLGLRSDVGPLAGAPVGVFSNLNIGQQHILASLRSPTP